MKKILSMLLTVVLSVAFLPVGAFAQVASPEANTCHHIHNEDCGYDEDTLCAHEHDENCGEPLTRQLKEKLSDVSLGDVTNKPEIIITPPDSDFVAGESGNLNSGYSVLEENGTEKSYTCTVPNDGIYDIRQGGALDIEGATDIRWGVGDEIRTISGGVEGLSCDSFGTSLDGKVGRLTISVAPNTPVGTYTISVEIKLGFFNPIYMNTNSFQVRVLPLRHVMVKTDFTPTVMAGYNCSYEVETQGIEENSLPLNFTIKSSTNIPNLNNWVATIYEENALEIMIPVDTVPGEYTISLAREDIISNDFSIIIVDGEAPIIKLKDSAEKDIVFYAPVDKAIENIFLELEKGTLPAKWSKTSATPAWLIIDESTGRITGMPQETGEYPFSVKAENDYGEDNGSFTIKIGNPPEITTMGLSSVAAESEYNDQLTASGMPDIRWSIVEGELPEGLKLNKETGTISGTQKQGGTWFFTVRAENDYGFHEKPLFIEIFGVAPIITTTFTNDRFPDALDGEIYPEVKMTATGTSPIKWTATNLPKGMWINEDGTITGIPDMEGLKFFSITATNEYGSDTKEFQIYVQPDSFCPVTNVTNLPAIVPAGEKVTLNGKVVPAEATNKAIIWSVKSAGDTGAAIKGNTLTTTGAGVAVLTATIINGKTRTENYTKDFLIIVHASQEPPKNEENKKNDPHSPPDDPTSEKPEQLPVYKNFNRWIVGGGGAAVARIDADFASFLRLMLNGNVVHPGNYTVTSGSTIITLKESYLNTLPPGVHLFRAEFTDGYTDLTLQVIASDDGTWNNKTIPKTSDNANINLCIALLIAAGVSIASMVVYRKKSSN